MRPHTDAVVFDLDGTLIDTAPDLHAHLVEVLHELGRPALPLAEVRPMIGDGARVLLQRGLEASGGIPDGVDLEALFGTFLGRYTALPHRYGVVFEGVVAVLEQLRAGGSALGICTNKPQAASLALLQAAGLEGFFDVVIGGDVLPVRKPDAGHIAGVLERLGTTGGRAVMVGDSRNDLAAARATGIPCVLVSFGYTATPAAELGADLVIDHFAELPQALAGLAGMSAPRHQP